MGKSTPEKSEKLYGVTVVIPVYNEAGAIEATVKGVARVFMALAERERPRPFEIIVVDDGSTDGSLDAISPSPEENLKTRRHEKNLGYGAAIKTGVRAAAHEWILILDADGTYPTEEIFKLIDELEDHPAAAMIVGQRRQTPETDGFWRLQGKAFLQCLANYLAETKIPDLNGGMRLMRKSRLERFMPLLPDGFSLTTSITLAMLCSGDDVRYVPIEYRSRQGESKIRPVRDMMGFIVLIVRTMTYFNPLKVYLPLTGFFVALSLVIVLLSDAITGEVMDVTALFLFIVGLQMLLIGVLADLILKVTGMRER